MLTTAIGIEELIEKVRRYNPDAQVELIRRAYDFSAQAHEGQLRRSGEPYLAHPLAVAEILTALRLDVPAIVAGLMHDTIEDTIRTRTQIEEEFGKDIARLVEGVTKIGKIHFKSYEETQAENFRKMLILLTASTTCARSSISISRNNKKSPRKQSKSTRPWRTGWGSGGCAQNSKTSVSRPSSRMCTPRSRTAWRSVSRSARNTSGK